MDEKPDAAIDPERELWRELHLSGLMPWRGPSGSLRNAFRIAAGSKMEHLLRTKFKGDIVAFTAALREERERLVVARGAAEIEAAQ